MTKRLLSLLLCLLLLSPVAACSAASYTISGEQLTRLQTGLTQLSSINAQLTDDLSLSNQQLATVSARLAQVESQLTLSLSETAKARQELATANASLASARTSWQQCQRQVKTERLLWTVGLAAALYVGHRL